MRYSELEPGDTLVPYRGYIWTVVTTRNINSKIYITWLNHTSCKPSSTAVDDAEVMFQYVVFKGR